MLPRYPENAIGDIDVKGLDNEDIAVHYNVTALKLHECALYEPGHDVKKDAELTALESQLMSIQECLLEYTATREIKTRQDFKLAKNIYLSASDLKTQKVIDPVHRLAMSLYQYLD